MKLAALFAIVITASAACLPVTGDRIVARDVAAVTPAFAALDPELALAFAPLPGVQRNLGGPELVRIASRFGLKLSSAPDICFEVPTRKLTRDEVLAAMQAALPDVEIELLDMSRYPIPEGSVSFARAGLNAFPLLTAESAVLWRGRV